MVTMETMQTQIETVNCACLNGFYECVFCHVDQSSAGFTKGPVNEACLWEVVLPVTDWGLTLSSLHGDCFHSIVPSSAVSFTAPAFFEVMPSCSASSLLKQLQLASAAARASGQGAFCDFSLLAGDFLLLCFSLEPSGQSLFNVMAVYFNKSHRFGQFKCVFSVVEVSQRGSVLDSTGPGGNVVEQPHKRSP